MNPVYSDSAYLGGCVLETKRTVKKKNLNLLSLFVFGRGTGVVILKLFWVVCRIKKNKQIDVAENHGFSCERGR